MNALILKQRVRREIQSKVDRILRELDNPEPPLRLELVFELLDLDRSYFTSESEGLMKMTFSRLKRAGKQILKRPALLGDAVKKFDLRRCIYRTKREFSSTISFPSLNIAGWRPTKSAMIFFRGITICFSATTILLRRLRYMIKWKRKQITRPEFFYF